MTIRGLAKVAAAEPEDIRIRYTKAEAARQLSISERTLDRLREKGDIIARVDGGRIFFDHSELVSYAKSCPVEGAA